MNIPTLQQIEDSLPKNWKTSYVISDKLNQGFNFQTIVIGHEINKDDCIIIKQKSFNRYSVTSDVLKNSYILIGEELIDVLSNLENY